MKKEKLLRSMNLVDEKYIAEASPMNNKKRSKKKWYLLGALAAGLCGMTVAFYLWLFLPFNTNPPDVSMYADSEYYPIIQKLNEITYTKPRYKNNFDLLVSNMSIFKNNLKGEVDMDGTNDFLTNGSPTGDNIIVPEADASGPVHDSDEEYTEVTDNQVNGVIEGDRIKRSDKYIYYLDEQTLRVFSIEGIDSKEVGSYKFTHIYEDGNSYFHHSEWTFYLSSDCKTITVIAPYYNKEKVSCVAVMSLDVSVPTDIRQKNVISVTGSHLSSRLVNGKLLLLTQFYVGKDPDFSQEKNYLPQIDSGNGPQSIPLENIISPETLSNPRYTVVCKLDENTLALEGSSAFLSYSQEVYVSNEHIYATRSYSDQKTTLGITTSVSMTEISAISYTGTDFEYKGSVSVAGYIKDQYSLDEYEGILRVVTTTDVSKYRETIYRNGTVSASDITDIDSGTNASLYCIDLNSWKIVAEVAEFAPPGEVVQSVRFHKNMAYVCTSIRLSDPVFFFDLSDLNNITYKDTGTIEGFSSSLIDFGDGFLLGIGIGSDWNTLKIEVYEETTSDVSSVCVYEVPNTNFSTEYKSYYVDRENHLIGLGVTSYGEAESERYVLVFFNNYDLIELINVPLAGNNDYKRAVYIDSYLYMFGNNDFKVTQVWNAE